MGINCMHVKVAYSTVISCSCIVLSQLVASLTCRLLQRGVHGPHGPLSGSTTGTTKFCVYIIIHFIPGVIVSKPDLLDTHPLN